MPLVTITLCEGKTAAFKKGLLQAVHDALVAAFKIPDHDRNQRIIEIREENFEIPPDRTENFLTIEMTVFPGRSLAAKRQLYREIVSRIEPLGVRSRDILIVLNEPPLDNWGVQGGFPASEVDLGFKLDV